MRGISTGAIFVAELGELVIGFSEGVPGEVVAVFVDPNFANRGIGGLLLGHALRLARGSEQPVRLEATLNAVPFYERFGFTQGERSVVRRNEIEVPIVVMHRRKKN
ncbi:MAG: putative N-acetyltransferase YafP [Betaproteobacteria bacterium ADurb.Bin341]|nr:MAG: putative N-acetyltransferase YafP [Betaproteobacteria bacterium ADurb.Bin341]